jgi:hypothetical protein
MLRMISISSGYFSGIERTYYPKMPLLQVVSCVLGAVGVADRGVLSLYVPHVEDLQGLE